MKIRRWWWMTTSSLLVYLTTSPSSAEKSSDNCKTEHFYIFVNFKKLLVKICYVSIDMPGSGASAGSWGGHIIHYIIVMSLRIMLHLASSLIFFSAQSPVLSSLFLFRLLLGWIRYTHSTTNAHSYSYSHTHTHTHTHARTHARMHTHTHLFGLSSSTLHFTNFLSICLTCTTTQHNYHTVHWPWLTLSPSGNTVCSTISSISVTKQNKTRALTVDPEDTSLQNPTPSMYVCTTLPCIL